MGWCSSSGSIGAILGRGRRVTAGRDAGAERRRRSGRREAPSVLVGSDRRGWHHLGVGDCRISGSGPGFQTGMLRNQNLGSWREREEKEMKKKVMMETVMVKEMKKKVMMEKEMKKKVMMETVMVK